MTGLTVRRAGRWVTATLVTGLALVGLARLSAVPVPYRPSNAARLRLSWSARPERIEACRTLTREELEEREEHMRQGVECDGRFATYDLRVAIDGREVIQTIERGGGFRQDRSMYVLREVDLPSGERHVRVSFTRRENAVRDEETLATEAAGASDTGIFAGRAAREVTERNRRARAAVPAELLLDSTISVSARQVVVITFHRERRVLEIIDARGSVAR